MGNGPVSLSPPNRNFVERRPIAAQTTTVLFVGGFAIQPADYLALVSHHPKFHISSPIPTTTTPILPISFPSTKSIAATSATALATFPAFDTTKPSIPGRLSSMVSSHVLSLWSVLDVTKRYCLGVLRPSDEHSRYWRAVTADAWALGISNVDRRGKGVLGRSSSGFSGGCSLGGFESVILEKARAPSSPAVTRRTSPLGNCITERHLMQF